MQPCSRYALSVALALGSLLALPVQGVSGEAATTPAENAGTTRYKPAGSPTPTAKKPRERTIAPFPVPGDSSAASVLKWRTLNIPRSGRTTVAPLPPPGSRSSPGAPLSTENALRVRLQLHQLDCDEHVEHPEPLAYPDPIAPPGTKPEDAKRIIRVNVVVDEAGEVALAETGGTPSPLDSAAVAHVRTMKFKPARHCGHELPVVMIIPVRFEKR